jgi:hypothetical protein
MSLHKWLLILILATNFILNIWGLDWGLPQLWHPDEMVHKAEAMHEYHTPDHDYHAYGSLPYYQIILLAVWPIDIWQESLNWQSIEIWTVNTWFARFISVLMATGIVWIVYGLGNKLFDRKTALISVGLMSVTMGLTNIAHFATADISSIFWSTLAAYFVIRTWQRGLKRDYILSGALCGIAAAVKYIGGIMILPLLIAHWLRKKEERSFNDILLTVITAMLTFMLGNASMIFSPCRFMVGFIKENFFNALRNTENPPAFIPLITEYVNATGWPIALLSMSSLFFTLWLIWKPRYRKEVLLITSMIVPYYIIIGRMHVSNLRYVIPMLPFILLLVGKMLSIFIQQEHSLQKTIWKTILIGTFIYSLLYTVVADLNFIKDSRYSLEPWLQDNVNTNESLEMTSYVSDDENYWLYNTYNVNYWPHDYAEWSAKKTLQKSYSYEQTLYSAYKIETWAKKYDLCPKDIPTYTSWHEKVTSRYLKDNIASNTSPQGLLDRNPDWLIISDLYYNRFLNGYSGTEADSFKQLLANELPYTLVKELEYKGWPGFTPRVEFVNPRLLVYKKQ